MEEWNGFEYGPLRVENAEVRQIRCGEKHFCILPKSQFIILLRLMSCYGQAVSQTLLQAGIASAGCLRTMVCRLRKFLKQYFGNAVRVIKLSSYGYKLACY